MEPNRDIKYKKRIIAFIDILGFKEIVKKSERSNKQLMVIKEALQFLKNREIPNKWNIQLIEIEEDAQKKNLDDFDISNRTNSSAFSDSIVVSVQFDESNLNESLSTLVANLSFVGSKLMTDGILIRGAITIGNIIHTDTGVVFGQGLIDAYYLETRSAKYPRIIISEKLINMLNYPLERKRNRYPYHQYLKRFDDGCLGFHQLIYFQVLQSWVKMSKVRLETGLRRVKKTIINGLDSSFESPDVHEKYLWLKNEYNDLIILEATLPKIIGVREKAHEHNIHYEFSNRINRTSS